MAYLSILMVLQEIHVGFLLVGHIHEDVDGYFSYLSKQLKTITTFVHVNLIILFHGIAILKKQLSSLS